jgi:molybdopterin/thiamine biosynthesis adenylyltransferase
MHDENTQIPEGDTSADHGAVTVSEHHWNQLRSHLLSDGDEHAALLICGVTKSRGRTQFLVRSVVELADADLLDSSSLHLSISPQSLARHVKAARASSASVILCHSHPFPGRVSASPIDLSTEAELCGRVFPSRLGGAACAALIVGPDGLDGRTWAHGIASRLDEVTVIGEQRKPVPATSYGLARRPVDVHESEDGVESDATARQELLWGAVGQRILRESRVVVVGCGGTGSHVVSQLAHLRVGSLTLVDPDVVEDSNLSRLIGSVPSDVGRSKVDVLAQHARRINPDSHVAIFTDSVLDIDPQSLIEADAILCATDGHGSRALLTELCQQYLVPVVDLGVEVVPGIEMFRAGGGVRVLRPGHGCLHCAQTLTPALVREEYLDAEQRAIEIERGYIRNHNVPNPSVVALNGVVASMAVLEVCQLLVGMLGNARDRLLYRAESRAVTTTTMRPDPQCYVCGSSGLLGLGDARPLPTRWRPTAAAS